jgi:hypothetical protein
VLVNPWVRSVQGVARAYLRHYYLRRLFQRSFWNKVARGEFRLGEAARALHQQAAAAVGREREARPVEARPASTHTAPVAEAALPARMEHGLRKFRGRVLLILTETISRRRIRDLAAGSWRWRRLLASARVTASLARQTIRSRAAGGATGSPFGPERLNAGLIPQKPVASVYVRSRTSGSRRSAAARVAGYRIAHAASSTPSAAPATSSATSVDEAWRPGTKV